MMQTLASNTGHSNTEQLDETRIRQAQRRALFNVVKDTGVTSFTVLPVVIADTLVMFTRFYGSLSPWGYIFLSNDFVQLYPALLVPDGFSRSQPCTVPPVVRLLPSWR